MFGDFWRFLAIFGDFYDGLAGEGRRGGTITDMEFLARAAGIIMTNYQVSVKGSSAPKSMIISIITIGGSSDVAPRLSLALRSRATRMNN
jgi:hypothetical protein